ncbi:hypothetical protein AJ80_01603 [Polytolypa hystricis UAMH7299]|uniref:Uncharacterized protein n=1 Tax=Polytolypa hystricis (strain UAMH7299) TaxID=1447883 RepID=A0A2B7Z1F0_POLH7|nr:hypothetical protein AJ80_01603 [Polytolypa hystricis UAMH7299]
MSSSNQAEEGGEAQSDRNTPYPRPPNQTASPQQQVEELLNGGEEESSDDDMDYVPALESFDNISEFDDYHYQDVVDEPMLIGAYGDLENADILLPSGHGEEDQGTDQAGSEQEDSDGDPFSENNAAQIVRILGANGLRRILQSHGVLGSDDDWFGYYRSRRRRRSRPEEDVFPKVPSDVGMELMRSGHYGTNPHFVDRLKHRKKRLTSRLMWRELASGTHGARLRDSRAISQGMIPSSVPDKIIHYDSRCYSGQFSDDGNFFFSCAQDFKVRMYDTSNPYDWKYYKTVDYPFGQWTITDASLSPDNRFLAYSSIRNTVCLAATDPTTESSPLLLRFASGPPTQPNPFLRSRNDFGIWSIRFSGDGREIVAGTSDRSVLVYDIEKNQCILTLQNHEDDVNAVCFGDSSSPHLIYSGSDDTTLRVWDRRSMADGREVGLFIGHTEGLTYVDSKGDGRYVLSNGKDQTMKLWDLRKMMSPSKFDSIDPNIYSSGFDYRFMDYTEEDYQPHPHDCSVVTFRGHKVLRTLIRCHFSPPTSTNSRYVYTGSEDGKVWVYNLDATVAGVIDVEGSSYHTRPLDSESHSSSWHVDRRGDVEWKTCVRDASWHPNAPVVAATSWSGWGMGNGTCTVHTWNDDAPSDEGEPALGLNYDAELKSLRTYDRYAERERSKRAGRSVRSQPVPAARASRTQHEGDW